MRRPKITIEELIDKEGMLYVKKWVTQFVEKAPRETLIKMLEHMNWMKSKRTLH